ncbi:Muramidase OS=Streptomyces alboniger OX=132473 GN=CP975_25030 PE=3 SV=1 [Streptomyces alboniger]
MSAPTRSSFDTDGLSFVIIKSTEGRSVCQPEADLAGEEGQGRRLAWSGFYHFLWPGNITAQAEYFVKQDAGEGGGPARGGLGVHRGPPVASNKEKDRFIKEVKRLRPSHRVLLYTNRDFWLNRDTTSYAGDALWIADYVSAGKPRIKAKWAIHQYTSSPLDKNVADFESEDALREWANP